VLNYVSCNVDKQVLDRGVPLDMICNQEHSIEHI
jgi:hypothetical protein